MLSSITAILKYVRPGTNTRPVFHLSIYSFLSIYEFLMGPSLQILDLKKKISYHVYSTFHVQNLYLINLSNIPVMYMNVYPPVCRWRYRAAITYSMFPGPFSGIIIMRDTAGSSDILLHVCTIPLLSWPPEAALLLAEQTSYNSCMPWTALE